MGLRSGLIIHGDDQCEGKLQIHILRGGIDQAIAGCLITNHLLRECMQIICEILGIRIRDIQLIPPLFECELENNNTILVPKVRSILPLIVLYNYLMCPFIAFLAALRFYGLSGWTFQ